MPKPPAELNVGPDFILPLDAVTQPVAFLAVRRWGKSNGAAVMAEEMFFAGLPWVGIDPKGDWWGLRADGTGPGLPIAIFGGLHGDLPLLPESGALMAELIVEHNLTCVLDVSRFSKTARARFLADFAERLYELHQADPQPRHVFLEEAHVYLPQRVMHDMARCVGAWTTLVTMGGAFGLGITILSQRAAVIQKDVLTQVELLIAGRTTSPQDRKAIRDWMEHHAIASEIVDSLPSLVSGEAWISSSFWLPAHGQGSIQRKRFRQRTTFDSGATPVAGSQRPPATLADIDLGALEVRMAAVVEKAAQHDPTALKRRIAELERQLAKGHQVDSQYLRSAVDRSAELEADNEALRAQLAEARARPAERIEVPAFQPGDLEELDRVTTALNVALQTVALATERVRDSRIPAAPGHHRQLAAAALNLGPSRRQQQPPAPAPPKPAVVDTAVAVTLKAGARNMLAVLARQHPVKVTRAQLATLAKLKITGGTFSTYFSTLKRAGLITEDGGYVLLTDAGFAVTGASPDLPITPDELRDTWRTALKAGARNMLDILLDRHPYPVSRGELAEAVGLEQTGGTFSTYLSTLRRNGLIDEASDGIRAADVFFLGGDRD